MSRFLKIGFILVLIVLSGVTIVMIGPFSKATYWWGLAEKPLRSFSGGEIKCQEVRWCDGIDLCINKCKSSKLSLEQASFDLLSGELKVKEWSYTPVQAAEKSKFPKLPGILRKIDLQSGMVLGYKVDRIELIRAAHQNHNWLTRFSLGERSLTGKGLLGLTKTDLKIDLNRFTLKTKLIGGQLSAALSLTNDGFLEKPLLIEIKRGQIQNLRIYASEIGLGTLNGKIMLEPDLRTIKEISEISAEAAGIKAHSSDKHNLLIADEVDLSKFKPYYRYLPKSDFQLKALNGKASIRLLPDFHNFRHSIFWADSDRLNSSFIVGHSHFESIPFKDAHLKYLPYGYLEIHSQFVPMSLTKIKEPAYKAGIEIKDGQIQGDFNFMRPELDAKPEILVNYQIRDGSATLKHYGEELEKIEGISQLHNETLATDLKMLYLGLPIQARTKTSLLSPYSGSLVIDAPRLKLQNFEIPELDLDLSGNLERFHLDSAINSAGVKPHKMSFRVHDLLVNHPKVFPILVKSGAVRLSNYNNLELQQLRVGFDGSQNVRLDANVILGIKPVLKSFLIDGNFDLKKFFESLKLSTQIQLPTDLRDLDGSLITRVAYHAGKFDQIDIRLKDINVLYKDFNFKHGAGGISYQPGNQISLDHLYTEYGENSNIMLNGKVGPEFLSSDPSKVFDGELKGSLALSDFDKTNFLQQFNLGIDPESNLPFEVKIHPEGAGTNFNLHLEKSASENLTKPNLIDQLDAKLYFDPISNFIKLNRFHADYKGLHFTAQGEGLPNDFKIEAFTDPVIDLGLLGHNQLKGIIKGSFKASGLSLFDEKTLWNNSSLEIESPEVLKIQDLTLDSLKFDFDSKNGNGLGHLATESGLFRNLAFNSFSTEFLLQNDYLELPSLAFDVADGKFKMSGELDLITMIGLFAGKAEQVELGKVAGGLFNEHGVSGRGDFDFLVDGYLWSLLKSEKPISVSGGFSLRNGKVTSVSALQGKLNLANLVFGGPLGLNINSFLEVFFPVNDSFFKTLDGRWNLDEKFATISEAYYRGKNDLDLNMAGMLERETGYGEFQFYGSYPRISKRVNRSGQLSEVWNLFSNLSLAAPLRMIGLLSDKPRHFTFTMKGSNPSQMNATATQTFRWIDEDLRGGLPVPELDDLEIKRSKDPL
ncbi:MAG: hypothetical protein SFT81_05645 [Candidatus Caenarcaniphilales bacterium]|nr:hypothetical protein [Candidatus Caenarcaniphilales bacterium]